MLCLDWGVESWGCGEWKCEYLIRKCEESWWCLDCSILEWMREKSLLKYVRNVTIVRIFWIIFNCVNYKITKLPLCIRKEELNDN